MSEQFQIPNPFRNPQSQESQEVQMPVYEVKLKSNIGSGPPKGGKDKLLPEDLIESGILIECDLKSVNWENLKQEEIAISENTLREIYKEQLKEIGISPEKLQVQQWAYLRKIAYPILPFNKAEKEKIDEFIKSLLDKAATITVSVIIAWLVLKRNRKTNINNVYKSNGGDIVIGTANYSTNIYLTSSKQTHLSSEILNDGNVGIDILTDKPQSNILKRPVIILKIDRNFVPVPETLGYQTGEEINHIIPFGPRRSFIENFALGLGLIKADPHSVFSYLKNNKPQLLEKSPEIIKLQIHYGNDQESRLFSSHHCLLVVDQYPYLLFSNQKVDVPALIGNKASEYISYEKEEPIRFKDDKTFVSEIGAIYLESIKHSHIGWPSWISKKLRQKNKKSKGNKARKKNR